MQKYSNNQKIYYFTNKFKITSMYMSSLILNDIKIILNKNLILYHINFNKINTIIHNN
jgi:hypothetical protein